MICILQTILKIDSQLGKNASQTAIRTRLIRALICVLYIYIFFIYPYGLLSEIKDLFIIITVSVYIKITDYLPLNS